MTRQDLSAGYQTVQSAHVVAEFADIYYDRFKEWKRNSNSLICLAVKEISELEQLCHKLDEKKVKYVKFYEPDVEQYTSIAIEPSEAGRKATSSIPLANRKHGTLDKHVMTKEKVLHDMSTTFQFKNQSVLQHGESVYQFYQKLVKCLDEGSTDVDLYIPAHYYTHWDLIKSNLYDEDIMKEYMVLHDLGKPSCLSLDAEGKQHFTDHAQTSHEVYMKVWGNPVVGELIRCDMDIHLLKDEGIKEFMEKSTQQICTHLMVGLAEVLSNAQMFGGFESLSFKIKMKALEKRSKKILANLFVSV